MAPLQRARCFPQSPGAAQDTWNRHRVDNSASQDHHPQQRLQRLQPNRIFYAGVRYWCDMWTVPLPICHVFAKLHQRKERLRAALVLMAVLIAAGCAHHPGDCALGIMDWDDCLPGTAGYNKMQQRLTQDDTRCQSYGLTPGTTAYATCRQNFEQGRVAHSNAVLGAVLGGMAAKPAPLPTTQPVPTFSAPVTTSCTHTGDFVNCQSY